MTANRILMVLLLVGSCCFTGTARAEHTFYKRSPNGLEVYRHHSLGANGAAVLTTGLQLGMPILGTFVNNVTGKKDLDEAGTKDLGTSSLKSCTEYAEQQRRANELLDRTARLVNYTDPVPVPQNGNGGTAPVAGANPWKINPE